VSRRLVWRTLQWSIRRGLAGQGIFQSLAIGLGPFCREATRTCQICGMVSDDELFRTMPINPIAPPPAAKVRALLDFIRRWRVRLRVCYSGLCG